ncbi:odorant-binding protein 59a [Drosophila nasuta]|uniref:odorant-binding protein 59a n=1 Tax=Drosophila nasuta TaxID=42062 RepID=UPI00295EE3D8|nr:odorant-binding protein 59a [Drosophila nasuta]
MRLLLIILLGFSCGTQSLKCRSQDGGSEEEMKRTVRSCMQRGSQGQNEGERRYDNQRYNFDGSYGQDYRQGQEGLGQQGQTYGNRWQRSVKHNEHNNSNNRGNNNTMEGEMGACVAQCFFEELNMVDANGQPDRRKVSYLLTKDLRDRSLRNFYMDTVQQCFRYLDQSRYNNNNKCSQARELIKCMSEYAKAQCDDWEEHSSLLFN